MVVSVLKRMIGPFVVIVLTALMVGVLVKNAPQPEVGEPETVRIGVYTESATRTGASAEVTVYGEVRPRVQIDVISEVAGRITAVSPSFAEGEVFQPENRLLLLSSVITSLPYRKPRHVSPPGSWNLRRR